MYLVWIGSLRVLEFASSRCEIHLLEWCNQGGDLCESTGGLHERRKGGVGSQAQQSSLWPQATPRAWNAKVDDTLKSIGFMKSKNDQGVYHLNSIQDKVIVRVYVDDLIITGASEAKVEEFKKNMMRIFEITDLGFLCSYLGIEVHQGMSQITFVSKTICSTHLGEFSNG